MDASLESLCAASETVPLLHNGQHSRGPVPRARVLQPQAAPRQRVQRSQPVSILAVRWAPASPRGPEGGWWGHCATLPPLRGQRVGDGVTAPPRLPSGVRGCVMGSLNHPASPQGSEGGWWDHCATSPPLRGQRVHGGVTVPPHLPSGVRGWVIGSLNHPTSPQGSEGGWWGHCTTCLPLGVIGWVVGSRCRALLGRPLLSLHPAGPLGVGPGTQFSSDQFYVHWLCARSVGVYRNTVQGHYCVSSSVIPNSLPSHGLSPVRLLCPWDSPGKNTGAGCHFLFQGIFPTQDSNADLRCRHSFPTKSPGKPKVNEQPSSPWRALRPHYPAQGLGTETCSLTTFPRD